MERASIDDPIFALASPWGESPIAVIRVAGKESLSLLSNVIRSSTEISKAKGHTIHHGVFLNPQNGEIIDEIMTAVYRAPKSYTGEDGAEIFIHGSPAIITAVLEILFKAGFRQAGCGEFTQRAFLNGKIDLTRAEAVNELIRARSDRARSLAIQRLSGAIEIRINELKERIADLLAGVEAMIDYPEEDWIDERKEWLDNIHDIKERISRLSGTFRIGKIIQEGIRAVIAGKTNSGKSTLFNLLLREDRAIVSETHGTTRDYLEGNIIVNGVPIRLFDTAGLRDTDNPLELEGIRRTEKLILSADLILYLVDGSQGIDDTDGMFLQKYCSKGNVLKIWNKTDLNVMQPPDDFIPLSAKSASGIDILHKKITDALINENSLETGEPVIDSLRQKNLLDECAFHLDSFCKGLDEDRSLDLLAVDLRAAVDCLGEITGAVSTEDILQRIFSRFCVGK